MKCKCIKCGYVGERFAIGDYIQNDESFKCKNCGYCGGKEKVKK